MNCYEIQDLILTDYLDGEMASEKKKMIDGHLTQCQSCREFLLTARQTVDRPFFEVQKEFEGQQKIWQKIKSQIEEEKTSATEDSVSKSWVEGFQHIFVIPRVGILFSVMAVAFLTTAVYFRTFSQQKMIAQRNEKIQLISDVANELSNAADDDKSYGTEIENYFL